MIWIKYTPLNLPPAGLKILCFKKGDCWTAYRFNYKDENLWIAALPSCALNPQRQYVMGRCDEPEYWCEIPFSDLPGTYTGRLMLKAEDDDDLYTVDEFQEKYPEEHDQFIKEFVFALTKARKKK